MYIECAIDVQIKHNIDTFPDSLGGYREWNDFTKSDKFLKR